MKRSVIAAISAALAILAIVSLFNAQQESGVARDEIDYMNAGKRYSQFWVDFWTFKDGVRSKENITKHFGGEAPTANNREHPPLLKTMFGFSWRWFHKGLGMNQLSAYRLPSVLFGAALVVIVFLFVARIWGPTEGVIAAALTLFLPRAFFHAGLATFDGAVVTMWIATVFAYYQALESRRWCIVLGVVYGLALATKHNAIFLPVPIIVHYVAIAALIARGKADFIRAFGKELIGRRPLILASFVLIGPLVFIALWPWLWFDTFSHFGDWIGFHLEHVHYNFEYLGENWNAPPFPIHVPIVTTLVTVPLVTLCAGVIGAIVLLVRAKRGTAAEPVRAPALLLFLSAGAAMGPFILRSTPIFGAEKHFAAAFPTIAIFAAIGISFAGKRLARRLSWYVDLKSRWQRNLEPLAIGLLGSICVASAAVTTFDSQPYALSHYNAIAGGAPGGADLGMNRQFWGVSSRGALKTIGELARERTPDKLGKITVYAHDADKTFGIYKAIGLLPNNIAVGAREVPGIRASQIAIVIHELHFNRHDYLIWDAYGTVKPIWVLRTDGVPIVSVYARAAKPAK